MENLQTHQKTWEMADLSMDIFQNMKDSTTYSKGSTASGF